MFSILVFEMSSQQKYPAHWGLPPDIQTMDYRPLPGGYGHGSSTLAHWIQKHLDEDQTKGISSSKTENAQK